MIMNRIAPVSGFTLVELVVVLAIAALLTVLAVPSFTELIEGQRARAAASDLMIALAKTRSEAIKRNVNVTLSPKSGDWANGWQVPDPTSGTVIEDHGAVSGLAISGPGSVVYQSSGRLQGGSSPSFSVSGDFADSTRCVSVDLSGRPNVKVGSC